MSDRADHPQARVMVAPGGRAAHASAAASRAAVHAVGWPACQAAPVSLTRCSARPRPGLLAAIAAFPAAWRRYAWIETWRRPRLFRRIRRRDRAELDDQGHDVVREVSRVGPQVRTDYA